MFPESPGRSLATSEEYRMELPDWIVDEVLVGAKPTAARLIVIMFRHGDPTVDRDGLKRSHWRGSLQSLSRIVGCSKRSLLEAEGELVAQGFLKVHGKTAYHSLHSISVAVSKPQVGDKLSPTVVSKSPTHDGDANHHPTSPVSAVIITTRSRAEEDEICSRLDGFGVSFPRRFLASHGFETCLSACDELDRLMDAEMERDHDAKRSWCQPFSEFSETCPKNEITPECYYGYNPKHWRSTTIRNPAGLLTSLIKAAKWEPENPRVVPRAVQERTRAKATACE
jgi:hypothetical protein